MFEKQHLNNIFNKFDGLKVMIIGDVMIDTYIWGSVKRLSPEAPVPIVDIVKRESRLGGASNVAQNVKSLGATPILCSIIGDDDKTATFLNLLKQENMPAHGIIKSKNRLTTVKFRIIGNNSHMLRVDEETIENLTKEETNILLERVGGILENEKIDVIIFEDYDKGVISNDLIRSVVDIANKKTVPVIVDPKKNNFFNYKNVDLFKPNFKELCEGLKVEVSADDFEKLQSIICDFQKKQNIKTVLVSLSELGVIVSEMDRDTFKVKHIPAHFRNIADVSGAGDTLIAVAALCKAVGADVELIAALSNLAGGVVCEYVGVVPVEKNKLLQEALKLLIK